ncbi:MAG TPA: TonB-dependent receptor, partial [Opitutus sp.]|nr:TonB-dependent receptor [Opitutus sp.]
MSTPRTTRRPLAKPLHWPRWMAWWGLWLAITAAAVAGQKKVFNLPAGPASTTLKLFSQQSGEQIVYPAHQVEGLQTSAVAGEMTAREALAAMLERSGLVAVADDATGALGVRRGGGPAPAGAAGTRRRAPPAPAATVRGEGGALPPLAEADDLVVLSPFEVSSESVGSYAAAYSLAGNRLNTELRDVGAAISVVTAQFLRDVGATSNESLLQYTPNTEVGGVQGTMANAGSGTQLDETNSFVRPNSNTRVRGLAAADNTRDFFITDIPWDSYNIDRIDFQRGPNAILFGLGSPAGIINAGTRPAGFRNEGSVEFRLDRFGSRRTALDWNHVLLDRELSVRFDALHNDEKFQQKPAFQRDQRVYGALRYEPRFLNRGSARTTFKANVEVGRIRSNRPRALPPGDALTPWFLTGPLNGYDADGNPFVYRQLNKMGVNALTVNENTSKVPHRNESNASYGDGTLNPYYQPWLGGQFSSNYFGNPLAVFDQGDSPAFRLVNISPTTVRGISPAGTVDQGIAGIPPYRNVSITLYRDVSKKVNLVGAKFGLTRNLQLSDPSIFDFYGQLIDGPNKAEWQDFRSHNLNLAQTFLDGKLGVEAVFDQQRQHHGRLSLMTDKGQAIFVDIMEVFGDGTLNPNFGRPFVADSSAQNLQGWTDRESFRLTAYLQHDFAAEREPSVLRRWLGRHVLTGLDSRDRAESDTRVFSRWVADTAYREFIAGPVGATIGEARRNVYPAIYLGPSLLNRGSAAGARIPAPTALAIPRSGSIRAFDSTWAPAPGIAPSDPWVNEFYPEDNPRRFSTQSENPANYRGLVDTPISILDSEQGHRDALTRSAQKLRTRLSSRAAIWQGYFWDGALVGMYGYRHDVSRGWGRTAPIVTATGAANLDPQAYTTHGVAPLRVADSSETWSAVAHLSQFLDRHDRVPLKVSVFFNRS